MNMKIVEREMVFAKAKLKDKQKHIISQYVEGVRFETFLTGIIVGAIVCLAALLAGIQLAIVIF